MFTTPSFYIGTIRQAVEQFQSRHGGFGNVVVIASHISSSDFTAQGYAESALDGVIFEVGRIAQGIERERQERFARQQALRDQLDTGVLTYEQWEQEYIFSF